MQPRNRFRLVSAFQRRHGMAAFIDGGDQIKPLVTSKQEQICALSGGLSTPTGFTTARVRRQDPANPGFPAVRWRSVPVAANCRIAGVADQYCAEQSFVIFADNKTFVDFFAFASR